MRDRLVNFFAKNLVVVNLEHLLLHQNVLLLVLVALGLNCYFVKLRRDDLVMLVLGVEFGDLIYILWMAGAHVTEVLQLFAFGSFIHVLLGFINPSDDALALFLFG